METNYKNIIKNGFFFIGGKVFGALASFAAVTALGYFVSRELAGTYNYVIAILSIINISTLPGMSSALVRAAAKGHDGSFFSITRKRLSWGMIGTTACIVIGLYFLIKGNSSLGITFFIAAPFVPLTDTFNDIAISYWQGKKRFDRSSLLFASYYAGIGILSIPIFILAKNSMVLVGGVLLAQTIVGFAIYLFTQKPVDGTQDHESEKLGFHLTAMHGFRVLANSLDKIIVFSLFGAAMTAMYTFASTPVSKVWQVIPIGALSLPELSRLSLTRDTKRLIVKKTLLLFGITIPLAMLLIACAPIFYQIFFPHYGDSVLFFRILSLTLTFSPLLFIKSALTAFHKTKELYINEIASPIIKIALMGSLGFTKGILGLAIGIVIGTVFEFLLLVTLFIKVPTTTK